MAAGWKQGHSLADFHTPHHEKLFYRRCLMKCYFRISCETSDVPPWSCWCQASLYDAGCARCTMGREQSLLRRSSTIFSTKCNICMTTWLLGTCLPAGKGHLLCTFSVYYAKYTDCRLDDIYENRYYRYCSICVDERNTIFEKSSQTKSDIFLTPQPHSD